MPLITTDFLRRVCATPAEELRPRRAFQICRDFAGLARWWLPRTVLEKAYAYDPSFPALTEPQRPELSERPGSSWVVFQRTESLPLLRPAFLLPLSWRPGTEHSSDLPRGLHCLADRVIDEVGPPEWKKQKWGLHLADRLQKLCCRLAEDLAFQYDSGWASLAASWIARASGLLLRRWVWASGAWDEFGLADIDELQAKIDLAREWQAEYLFVPVWRVGEARRYLAEIGETTLRIEGLAAPIDDNPKKPYEKPRRALKRYLSLLTAQPATPDPGSDKEQEQFDQCRAYYLNQPAFQKQERNFYWSHLLPGIIRRCRAEVEEKWPDWQPTHFATIVSRSHELAVLAPRALDVKHCLLLYTPDLADLAADCLRRLEEHDVKCELRSFAPNETMMKSIMHEVQKFTENVSPERVVLDLKPGTKWMTFSVSRAARPGNWLLNLEAKFLEDRRNDPGTERFEREQVIA